jgi:hypothetical protein
MTDGPEDEALVETPTPGVAQPAAVADKVKCDGDHGAPRCGAAPGQCWQDDPPEGGGEFDWSAGEDANAAGDPARLPTGGRA